MTQHSFPAFFHPIVTVCIGNTLAFEVLLAKLSSSSTSSFKHFTDLSEGIQYITQHKIKDKRERPLEINFIKVASKIYDKERFNKICLIIIDDEINSHEGIQACTMLKEKFNDLEIFLTVTQANEAQAKILVEKGIIIDFLVKKDNPTLVEKPSYAFLPPHLSKSMGSVEVYDKLVNQMTQSVLDILVKEIPEKISDVDQANQAFFHVTMNAIVGILMNTAQSCAMSA